MIYIIGSGLSGIAAAVALVKRGFRPTILDAGVRTEPAVSDLKRRLASVEPEEWPPEDVARLKRTGPSASTCIPQKLHFGSDFAYRDVDASTSVHSDRASVRRSFAQGGFSNVWGGVIQPLPPAEFRRWPFAFERLAPHYSAIHELIGSSDAPVQPSQQARALHRDLKRHQPDLEREGIRFEYATLAVKGCRHCGLCLYGCPYDSIFSAAAQLSQMIRQGLISYIPNVLVDRISAVNHRVRIDARLSKDNETLSFEGKAVFLATGLLESARIVLNSTNQTGAALRVQQSDIFTIPMLRYRSSSGISAERIHTLCQTIVEITDAAISPQPIQLQLYGYNDIYSQILGRRAGPFAFLLRPLSRSITERLVVAFGYLHSDVSSDVRITQSATGRGRLHLEGRLNEQSRRISRAVVQKLFRIRNYSRTLPMPLQLRFDEPGGAHRSGCCFPMRPNPSGLETDLLGRIPGLPGMYLIDASVLPSVPARPVAFTVMANAHRIASECSISDGE